MSMRGLNTHYRLFTMSESPNTSDTEKSYAGHVPPLATAEQRRRAVEIAFDFRGDVAIETQDGETIEGFVYDRQDRPEQGLVVRVMPKDGSARRTIPAEQITRLTCDQRRPRRRPQL